LGLLLAAGLLVSGGENSSSADGMAVRAVYTRLLNAAKVHQLRERVLNGGQDKDEAPRLELADWKAGPVSDLLETPLMKLVTPPGTTALSVTPGQWSMTTAEGKQLKAQEATFAWTAPGPGSASAAENWNVTLGTLFQQGVFRREYTRYVSYAVRLAVQGREAGYRALFLFGDQLPPVPIDYVVGAPALQAMEGDCNSPGPLLKEPFRSRADVQAYLESLRATEGCSIELLTGLCCNPVTGHCGVPATLQEDR
jgi:hypothetical protein